MQKRIVKIFCLIFALLMFVLSIPISTSAKGVENPMHSTRVTDDLVNMGFDLSKYPRDTSADWIKVLDFVEYGYDKDGDQEYYGLYLYIYNPSGREIVAGKNQVQMSFRDVAGKEVPWQKYGVTRMSTSLDTGNEYVFYKLYVAASATIVRQISGAISREYNVSGLELMFAGSDSTKPVDNLVDSKWIYTGYMENFGSSTNTLHCNRVLEERIRVKMEAASWYSRSSDLGEDYRYEVSSVYFNIPNVFIEEYGNPKDATSGLREVEGEYYKYVTDGLVVPDQKWYNRFYNYVDISLTTMSNWGNSTIGGNSYGFYDISFANVDNQTFMFGYELSYNMYTGSYFKNLMTYVCTSSDIQTHICNLAISSDNDTMYLSQEDFLDTYNKWGRNSYGDTGGLSNRNADIFTGLGHRTFKITTDDGNLGEGIKTYASSKKGFTKWLDKLFNKHLYDDEGASYDIQPIVELKSGDLGKNMTAATIAENLYVMVEDVESIRNFYDEYSDNNHIYLMRLEVNPYYAPEVILTSETGPESELDPETSTGIYFEKAIFEDIDIFTFTFEDKDGKRVSIPVSCDPIDNVGAVVPGNNAGLPDQNDPGGKSRDDSLDWLLKFWQWFLDQEIGYKILVIIVIIIAIILLIRIFGALLGVGSGAVIKAMGSIAAAPFRAANKVRKRVREKSSEDSDEKAKKKPFKIKVRKEKEKHPGIDIKVEEHEASPGLRSGRELPSGKKKKDEKKKK